jgi:hypothetical protein
MADLRGFNANDIEPTRDFEPIPAGKYLASVTASETKPNKAGTGAYLEVTFTILEGEYKNRLLWARYNLKNPNEMAVKIAQAELAALCRAVGVMTPRDSVELHNLPLVIKVKCKKRQDNDEIVNEIKGYEKRDAGGGRPQQAPTSTPPWRRP